MGKTTQATRRAYWTIASLSLAVLLIAPHNGHAVHPGGIIQSLQIPPNVDSWNSLTPSQKQALQPLAGEWDTFPPDRKKKWMVFAEKFQKMSPDEQKRVQEKIQEWVKLTPEQRLAARENYIRSNKLQPDQRTLKWQEYQQLTEEQKAELSSHREQKNLLTTLPTPEESRLKKLQPLKKPHRMTPPEVNTAPQPAGTTGSVKAPDPVQAQPPLPSGAATASAVKSQPASSEPSNTTTSY